MWSFLALLLIVVVGYFVAQLFVWSRKEIDKRERAIEFMHGLRRRHNNALAASEPMGRLGAPASFGDAERVAWYLICNGSVSDAFKLDAGLENPFTDDEWGALGFLREIGFVKQTQGDNGIYEWRFVASTHL